MKSGLPSVVTLSTKSTIDCLAGPSLHEGRAAAPDVLFRAGLGIIELIFQIEFFELPGGGAERSELINARARWRESE
jgi:hypothetical protein